MAGMCDAHTHVFGPYEQFPDAGGTTYTPPLAPFDRHAAMLQDVGIDRAVLIQPTSYFRDHRALLDALSRSPSHLRGVGVINDSVSDEELAMLRSAGVVGLRFVEMPNPAGGGRYPGTTGFDCARSLADRLRQHGFHLQLWAPLAVCAQLAGEAAAMGMPLVLDHMAGIGPEAHPRDEAFAALLAAFREGNLWIKLTYHRQSKKPRDYSDMRHAVDLLAEANPDRLLYASDWPFVRMEGREPDPHFLLSQAHEWLGQERFRKVLVDNSAALFEFD